MVLVDINKKSHQPIVIKLGILRFFLQLAIKTSNEIIHHLFFIFYIMHLIIIFVIVDSVMTMKVE